jgi:hypothetical protein
MSFERISDESVARYYESIRQQADADRKHKEHFTARLAQAFASGRTSYARK